MNKKLIKIAYYSIFLIAFICYIILLGVILTLIFNFVGFPDSMNVLKQVILLVIAFLLIKPILYTFMGWLGTKMGLTVEDFKKKQK